MQTGNMFLDGTEMIDFIEMMREHRPSPSGTSGKEKNYKKAVITVLSRFNIKTREQLLSISSIKNNVDLGWIYSEVEQEMGHHWERIKTSKNSVQRAIQENVSGYKISN